jgi:AcrR family transcriptional regulator
MTIHKSYEARVDSVVQAACALIEAEPLESITMAKVATAAGISRAWLYQFFPDLASVYLEIYNRTSCGIFDTPHTVPTELSDVRGHLRAKCDLYLGMRPACAVLGSYVLNSVATPDTELANLRRKAVDDFEHTWINPLVAAGNAPEDVWASVLMLLGSIFALVTSLHNGRTSIEAARTRLLATIDMLVDSTNGLS